MAVRYGAGVSNAYREVHALQREREGGRGRALLPVLAAVVAVPFAQPVLLGFLESGRIGPGTEAIALRLGLLVAAAMAMHTYADLVRGPDRAVLDPHPVQPRALLSAIALRTARERAYLPLGCAVLLAPIAVKGHLMAWAGGSAVAAGAWVASLGAGFAVHLGGVRAARSEGLAALLDLLRGTNPRMQAALIYAPGVAVAAVGTAVAFAASGLGAALGGWSPGWWFLGLPPLLGGVGWLAARPLAERSYVRATALLTEIDGMYAGREDPEESRRVYLEWSARRSPELRRVLRQGWRRLRLWPMGAWGLGLLGGLAGWSKASDAPDTAVAVALAAVLLLGSLPAHLAEGDPPWLDCWLGVSPARVGAARAVAAWLYSLGAIVPTAAALALRHGAEALWRLAAVVVIGAVAAVVGASLASRWRRRAVWSYGPAALVVWWIVVGRALG